MQKDQQNARAARDKAIANGTLVPEDCENCGADAGESEGHHYKGHEERYWLIVEWLCHQCNTERRANMARIERRTRGQ